MLEQGASSLVEENAWGTGGFNRSMKGLQAK